ncbi:MAG: isoprenylcysteine carboxylmethyltransferase family protein [Caldilineales bacterium]|nr:isoprenylcysteine carboxylmethyltransferase family protein [Caldilineales bacterium]
MNEVLVSLLIVIVGFAIWALLHSVLAMDAIKQWSERRLGQMAARWYRLAYNFLAVFTFLPLLPLLALLPERTMYAIPQPWNWLFRLVQLAGAVLFIVALWQTDLAEFVGLRQVASGTTTNTAMLRVRGLQKWVRHPLYTTSLMVLWFVSVMTLSWLVACMLTTLYFYVGSIHEERRLVREFGQPYNDYRERTPRLFPYPRRRQSPDSNSSQAMRT